MVGAALAFVGGGAAAFLRIPETENHLLMIETSRYLNNQEIIRELGPGGNNVDVFQDDQEEVKEWLLERLQGILKNDFQEYNARPYQRYSVTAILNLHDFADDNELRTAAQIVLEAAMAKFAVASSQGRRIVPFRRLVGTVRADVEGPDLFLRPEPRQLFEAGAGNDYLISVMLLFAGQTQQLATGTAPPASRSKRQAR